MFPTEIIALKRDKKNLAQDQIDFMVQNYAQGKIPDYQMSAFLMATLLNDMTPKETLHLTMSMMNSGVSLDWTHLNMPSVDKHSTGGVGDKASIILGPLVACFDVAVPMIAGRGLGHSGGTVDKLESIPGFQSEVSLSQFRSLVKKNNIAMIAQTKDICPADKKIYALRDVTATVESIPLICASIMSKKLAEGAGALVLDVKFGNGAFMTTTARALDLAKKLKQIGQGAGRKMSALITNMNQPLGQFVGNSVEIQESIDILQNSPLYPDCRELSVRLAVEMLLITKRFKTEKEARKACESALASGQAFEKFERMVALQKGNLSQLPKPAKSLEVTSKKSGFLSSFNTRDIGYAGISLKAGRAQSGDKINPVAGIQVHKKIGDRVEKGEPLFTIMSHTNQHFEAASQRLAGAYGIQTTRPAKQKLIYKKI